MQSVREEEAWRRDARCRGYGVNTFYPEKMGVNHPEVKIAKRICRQCPVQEQCLIDAINHGDQFGIQGNMTPRERRKLMRSLGSLLVVKDRQRKAA
jgi:WhiB family transcriptional regulator, redox-sensing transcriptional regulator